MVASSLPGLPEHQNREVCPHIDSSINLRTFQPLYFTLFFRATLLTPLFLLFSYPRVLLQTQETCTGKPSSRPAPLKSESTGGVK